CDHACSHRGCARHGFAWLRDALASLGAGKDARTDHQERRRCRADEAARGYAAICCRTIRNRVTLTMVWPGVRLGRRHCVSIVAAECCEHRNRGYDRFALYDGARWRNAAAFQTAESTWRPAVSAPHRGGPARYRLVDGDKFPR